LPGNNKILFFLLPLILALFLFGLTRLFMLRFEAGDVYPAYSSLRADPLGAKALYESLINVKPLSVGRNYHPLTRLDPAQETTLFYLGAQVTDGAFYSWEALKAFDRFALRGGRVIISFFPVKGHGSKKKPGEYSGISPGKREERDEKGKGPKGSTEDNQKGADPKNSTPGRLKGKSPKFCKPAKRRVSIEEHWGLRFGYEGKAHSANLHPQCGLTGEGLPHALSWHTALYFRELKKNWQVIYARNGHPVIMERQLGRGTIVLCADSYLFSNEALSKERHPHLLAWIMGKNSRALFDESHFGIQESPGVAGLARRYGLHWLFFGILLLAGLFVWKNSVYFTPPPAHDPSLPEKGLISTRDYTEGLTSLLRRSISSRSILSVCFEEWKKTADFKKQGMDDRLEQVKEVVNSETSRPAKGGDPVGKYRAICEILSKGKKS